MRIGVLGCNYKSSDLLTREAFIQGCLKCFQKRELPSLGYILLATCNRTEIYFSAEDLAFRHSQLLNLLRSEIEVPFEHLLYSYFSLDCFRHLALVTSGLDSVILGESEIQRQVKEAYEKSCLYSQLDSCLHHLFQKSIKIAKNARTIFSLEKGEMSLPKLIYNLSKEIVEGITSARVLFMGNSEINRNVVSFFKAKGVDDLTCCTRAPYSARDLMEKDQIKVQGWSELYNWGTFDIVICGTYHTSHLLKPCQIKEDGHLKTKVILDLGVPRNVDPKMAKHPQITLLNIEELGRLITERRKVQLQKTLAAERWVAGAAEQQYLIFKERGNRVLSCT